MLPAIRDRLSPGLSRLADGLLGAALALACVFFYLGSKEDSLFRGIAAHAIEETSKSDGPLETDEARALAILHDVHLRVEDRIEALRGIHRSAPGFFWPSTAHFHDPGGACMSYAVVLAKALRVSGIPVRKVGLADDHGVKGIHHVLEARLDGRWVLMDAGYDMVFRHPDGRLASVREVSADWAYFGAQTPPHYNPLYNYASYYYTNWDIVPCIGWLVTSIPPLHAALEARCVSIRFIILDVYRWGSWLCLALAAAAAVFQARLSRPVSAKQGEAASRPPGQGMGQKCQGGTEQNAGESRHQPREPALSAARAAP